MHKLDYCSSASQALLFGLEIKMSAWSHHDKAAVEGSHIAPQTYSVFGAFSVESSDVHWPSTATRFQSAKRSDDERKFRTRALRSRAECTTNFLGHSLVKNRCNHENSANRCFAGIFV